MLTMGKESEVRVAPAAGALLYNWSGELQTQTVNIAGVCIRTVCRMWNRLTVNGEHDIHNDSHVLIMTSMYS